MQINSLPVRIVSWIKGTTFRLEFIRKHQLPRLSGRRHLGVCRSGRIRVDEAEIAYQGRDLPATINTAETKDNKGTGISANELCRVGKGTG